ncbi:MAG: UMP kinase [Oscillospiraceae bacterium]|jgi:uridylate kinase|nr:UMP kinase [Oscillospiraceae bacterium]
MELQYRRVLLKISGEALAGGSGRGIDFDFLEEVCRKIKKCVDMGVQVGIVIGGGNYWRGVKDGGGRMRRSRADYMGMLATAMNCLAALDCLERVGVEARLLSAIAMNEIGEAFSCDKAIRYLEEGKTLLFACGTGEPYFSTDTAAALRAVEIEADAILLAKNVDGVYDKDPKKDPSAKKFDEVSYAEVLSRRLGVMDMPATSLAMENNIPIQVFALEDTENIVRAVTGEKTGTKVF